jgi:hypothetical protein
MTNESINEPTEATTESAPEIPTFETGFLVVKSNTGSWHVLTDLSAALKIEREVSLNEVRVGSSEVSYSLGQQQLAALIITALAPQPEGTIEE